MKSLWFRLTTGALCRRDSMNISPELLPNRITNAQIKNKKMKKELSAGTDDEKRTKDDSQHVSLACIKPNVVRSFLSPTEIRIGNCVKGVYGNCFIHSIAMLSGEYVLSYLNSQFNSHHDGLVSLKDCEPIKITEAVLKQCGFELKAEKDDVFYTGWFYKYGKEFSMRIWEEESSDTFRFSINNFNSIWVKSLHQLQNLYFALAGYELEVVLK